MLNYLFYFFSSQDCDRPVGWFDDLVAELQAHVKTISDIFVLQAFQVPPLHVALSFSIIYFNLFIY